MAHGGQRQVTQFQAIPAPPTSPVQTLPGHPGGVIDLERRFAGLDTRWRWQGELAERPVTLTAGWAFDEMREHRRGYQNFDDSGGAVRLGVPGALRRDEGNTARIADPYLHASWSLHPDWTLAAGLRHSHVRFGSNDRYIVPGNGDDSGSMSFEATTPVLSLTHRWGPNAMAYVSAARSFETPTLNEVAYASTSGAQSGWNRGLRASHGTQIELGGKWQGEAGRAAQVALFQVRTQDEIGVAENAGGRSVFRNVGATERVGLELSAQARIAPGWHTRVAAAWTRAEYQGAFMGGGGTVSAGRALPGVPRRTAWAELVWRPMASGWHSALSWRHSGRIWANDVNDAFAPASQAWSWRAGWRQAWSGWRLDATLWVDNLTDERNVGSVIVNEGSRRYFEPAPGRSATISATVTRVF
ncbi:MAG: TonB-dependent receptor [Gammaproteobacteria bacterium]|nr:TonB-dependent receptor [Gammaproteobacteria bacterium]